MFLTQRRGDAEENTKIAFSLRRRVSALKILIVTTWTLEGVKEVGK